jgi:hypothetical protein
MEHTVPSSRNDGPLTTRRTTGLILGILLGISVAAMMVWAAPRPLFLVRLRDDFSGRTFMKDDTNGPVPPQESEVVFFPAVVEEVHRSAEPEPEPPARMKPPRPPDPLEMPRTRTGAYDRLSPKR